MKFFTNAAHNPENPAIVVDGEVHSYGQLASHAKAIAATINQSSNSESTFGTFLAYRSPNAYASILGILATGKAYVPLSPKVPLDRNVHMLNSVESDFLIVSDECMEMARQILEKVARKLVVIVAESECDQLAVCLLYTSPSPRDRQKSRMPSSA